MPCTGPAVVPRQQRLFPRRLRPPPNRLCCGTSLPLPRPSPLHRLRWPLPPCKRLLSKSARATRLRTGTATLHRSVSFDPSHSIFLCLYRESSDDSGTDGDEEDEAARKKKAESVPDWARGPNLKAALERQYGMHGGVRSRCLYPAILLRIHRACHWDCGAASDSVCYLGLILQIPRSQLLP
jgi:hypothetical protein